MFFSVFVFRHHQHTNNRKSGESFAQSTSNNETVVASNGTRDASIDFSTLATSETTETELKTMQSNYPPQYHGVPPPPAFVNHFSETNDDQSADQQKH